jgi:hypothetical protein
MQRPFKRLLEKSERKKQLTTFSNSYSEYEGYTRPKTTTNISPIPIFYSYAEEDETFRVDLEKHLSMLKREGVIAGWHFRMITAGKEWEGQIDQHINQAKIILLLVSPDFLASDYCYDFELKKAMQLHKANLARVIPIILRPVDWQSAPFGRLQALPKDGKPITQWPNRDEAFLDIAKAIRQACNEIQLMKPSGTIHIFNQSIEERHEDAYSNIYCSYCGATLGERRSCIGIRMDHDFKSYPGQPFCARCGAKPGERTMCIGFNIYHDFKLA